MNPEFLNLLDEATLVRLIAGMAALCLGLAVWVIYARAARSRSKQTGDFDGESRVLLARLKSRGSKTVKILAVAGFFGAMLNATGLINDLLVGYAKAGYPRRWTDNQLAGILLLFALPVVFAAFFGLLFLAPVFALFAPFFGFGVAYLGLKVWIDGKYRRRIGSVSRLMPYVMDLIAMTMNAGASLLMAIEIVGDNYRKEAIGEEFTTIFDNVQNGMSIAAAMGLFKGRYAMVPSVASFADDVITSQRYGNPLTEILENSSARIKNLRIQAAREEAGKAKVKILAPGVIILFGSLLLLFGPFVVKFLEGEGADAMGF
ncbi:MAG: type II secretion system F family protein [Planctomycetota bacterium]|jgi:Flp pilus assembly protein TadB|nr:type II secretion system F family protein [Planctomycetota bacterium]